MTKYRLKKDLPGYMAGTIFEENQFSPGYYTSHPHYTDDNGDRIWFKKHIIEVNPEWFEKVEEPLEKKWTDAEMEDFARYYYTYLKTYGIGTANTRLMEWKGKKQNHIKC